MSEHLKCDTEFLDKDAPQKEVTTSHAKLLSEKNKYYLRIFLWVGVVMFIILAPLYEYIKHNTDTESSTRPSLNQTSPNNETYNSPVPVEPPMVQNEAATPSVIEPVKVQQVIPAFIVSGKYRCSRYNHDKVSALNPDDSEQQIAIARNALNYRSNEIDRLKTEINSSYVNKQSSQYEINQYNAMVNNYNSKIASYKRDATNFSSRIHRYNAQVEAHNDYLKNNCKFNK